MGRIVGPHGGEGRASRVWAGEIDSGGCSTYFFIPVYRLGYTASLYNTVEEEEDSSPTPHTFTCNRGVWTGVLRCVNL